MGFEKRARVSRSTALMAAGFASVFEDGILEEDLNVVDVKRAKVADVETLIACATVWEIHGVEQARVDWDTMMLKHDVSPYIKFNKSVAATCQISASARRAVGLPPSQSDNLVQQSEGDVGANAPGNSVPEWTRLLVGFESARHVPDSRWELVLNFGEFIAGQYVGVLALVFYRTNEAAYAL